MRSRRSWTKRSIATTWLASSSGRWPTTNARFTSTRRSVSRFSTDGWRSDRGRTARGSSGGVMLVTRERFASSASRRRPATTPGAMTPFIYLSLFGPMAFYLRIHGLTCGNAELTRPRAVAIFRFAPSSRGDRRERAGRAAGTPKGEPDARDQGRSARGRGTPTIGERREAGPDGPRQGHRKVNRAGGPRGTGRRKAVRSPRMTEERREASHRRRSGSRAKSQRLLGHRSPRG